MAEVRLPAAGQRPSGCLRALSGALGGPQPCPHEHAECERRQAVLDRMRQQQHQCIQHCQPDHAADLRPLATHGRQCQRQRGSCHLAADTLCAWGDFLLHDVSGTSQHAFPANDVGVNTFAMHGVTCSGNAPKPGSLMSVAGRKLSLSCLCHGERKYILADD